MSFSELASAMISLETLIVRGVSRLRTGPDGALTLDVCGHLRKLGCGAVLMDLDADQFVESLTRSGEMYLSMLTLQDEEPVDEYYLWRSQGAPLFDALAAGNVELAVAISTEMTDRCRSEDGESEEDFRYSQVVGLLAAGDDATARLGAAMRAFENALQGGESRRYDVVRAIIDRDQGEFDEVFAASVVEWQEELVAGGLDPYGEVTTAFISVEGLALARLARLRGLQIANEYQFIPDVVLDAAP